MDKTLAQLLLEVFGGNPYHARARTINNEISYAPVESSLNEMELEKHLAGEIVLGSYQLIQGADVVNWFGWDVDSPDLQVGRSLTERIMKHLDGIPFAIEYSGRKGYHILVFLTEPIQASEAKSIVEWVRTSEGFKSIGTDHVECFPKQDKLTKSKSKGNLLKIPLGKHPRSGKFSRFVHPAYGWEDGQEVDPIYMLSTRATPTQVRSIMQKGPSVEQQLVSLLAEYWVEGKRHELCLYLAGFLCNEGWGMEQSKALVRAIMEIAGDDEDRNREEIVENTFERYTQGKSVRGRQGLGEILPQVAMGKMTELVSTMRAPDTVAQIDEIRNNKRRPAVESSRLAAATIWSVLGDDGDRIFKTADGTGYWYNAQDHTVIVEGGEAWQAMANKRFGINPSDGFTRLVNSDIHTRILTEAITIPVQNRTYWSDDQMRLFVNFGGPEVFILDGNTITTGYNGECGFMFLTDPNGVYTCPDFDATDVDAWEELIEDLSFTDSRDAPAKPEEQKELLKAWILAFFFQELMPTKPILAMLGQPGSGKTTAMRRILRVLENPEEDVLALQIDKQDAMRSSIERHRLLVLDNLEKTSTFWLVDFLNRLATGGTVELRELYHTNLTHVIKPKCFVACTAVNMPFSDETLFSRLLVLEMQEVHDRLPESQIQRKIREDGPAIIADLLRKLNKVVAELRKNKLGKINYQSRLVDFTSFCQRIMKSGVVDETLLDLGLTSMVDSQMRQLKESSKAITLLEEWVSTRPEEANSWHTYNDIYQILSSMAMARKQDFPWKSGNALARHLDTLRGRLKQDFGAEFKQDPYGPARKEVTSVRFVTLVGQS